MQRLGSLAENLQEQVRQLAEGVEFLAEDCRKIAAALSGD